MELNIIACGLALILSLCILLVPAGAHCDTLDGPVVTAAKEALDTGDANPVLIWVQEKDEAQIREAFNKTLSVRKLSPETKDLADMYFFETLVRVHRAGEGASYTGLKPAGLDRELRELPTRLLKTIHPMSL